MQQPAVLHRSGPACYPCSPLCRLAHANAVPHPRDHRAATRTTTRTTKQHLLRTLASSTARSSGILLRQTLASHPHSAPRLPGETPCEAHRPHRAGLCVTPVPIFADEVVSPTVAFMSNDGVVVDEAVRAAWDTYRAPDATRWGLVPLSLHQLTGTKATFSLREAHEVMQGLEDVQRARWRRRRADARELHASRHTRPTPPPPCSASAPSPARPAVPQARSNAPETAQREKPSPSPPPSGGGVPSAGTQPPAPQTASAQPSVGHDGQPGGLAIPPLPRHPPLSPLPPLPVALPDGAEPGRRRGLRAVLRQLLRGKPE